MLGVDPGDHRLGEGGAVDSLGEGTERRKGGQQGGGDALAIVDVGQVHAYLRDPHDLLPSLSRYVLQPYATGQGFYSHSE